MNGEVADKPGRLVAEDAGVSVSEDPNPYVGRGGLKLAQALKDFDINPAGKTAVDVGASTGGFTDCLLQGGAAKVFAVDVGYGQLDWKLRSDDRVVVIDRKNARELSPEDLGGEIVDLAVIDVSFISLKLVLPAVFEVLQPEGQWVALVKPQFEVGKDEVEHKGVITDRSKHAKVLREIAQFAEQAGWSIAGICRSPITGQKGNQEYLVHGIRGAGRGNTDEEMINRTVEL